MRLKLAASLLRQGSLMDTEQREQEFSMTDIVGANSDSTMQESAKKEWRRPSLTKTGDRCDCWQPGTSSDKTLAGDEGMAPKTAMPIFY